MPLFFHSSFSTFITALRRVWRRCVPRGWWWGPTPYAGSPFQLTALWGQDHLQSRAGGGCSLRLPLHPTGLGSMDETRRLLLQAGVCIQHEVRATALAYVADLPSVLQQVKYYQWDYQNCKDTHHVCTQSPGGENTEDGGEFALYTCLEQPFNLEPKTYRALGQGARGNSKLKET